MRSHDPEIACAPFAPRPLLRTEQSFDFIADGPTEVVAPLLGAHEERAWAPGWNPDFVWPCPARDCEGMVFTVDHDGRKAVWVNSRFDIENGAVQYVYVVPERMVTVITLHIGPRGRQSHVTVIYERTALDSAANDDVRRLAELDANAGPEWAQQINACLAARS